MNFRECLVVRATFEHLLCLHSLQRSIYFPFSHMADTQMDFSGCGRDMDVPCAFQFASGCLQDIHP